MVCFTKTELDKFDVSELKRMMEIFIIFEKFEDAAILKDVISERKKYYDIDSDTLDDDNSELQ